MTKVTRSLLTNLAKQYNPSHKEDEIKEFVKDWIAENTNGVEVDTESARPNLLFHLTIGGRGDETSPGILLNAHLDSEGVKQNPAVRFKKPPPGSGRLVFPEGGKSVGLDNKTGIAVILSTLHALTLSPRHPDWRPPDCAGAIRLYVLFTVEEEIGQRGALWMPIEWLKNSEIRHAICVDRRTDQHPEGQRHVVTEYHKVPLLVPTDRAMLEYLNRASKELGFSEEIPCSQSCNCSDAIELRGRFDAEVILPVCSGETADELKEKYDATTEDVRKDPHCSMRESPRKDRYNLMKRIYDHVYKGRVPPNLQFSVLNLSLDYPDNKREEYLELSEICNTRRLLMKVLELIAGDATR